MRFTPLGWLPGKPGIKRPLRSEYSRNMGWKGTNSLSEKGVGSWNSEPMRLGGGVAQEGTPSSGFVRVGRTDGRGR
jgi:hypothetical protein